MSELEEAWHWCELQRARLEALDTIVRDGRLVSDPKFGALLGRLVSLPKKDRLESVRKEREDFTRMALVRLFAGFEADVRAAFARRLIESRAKTSGSGTGSQEDVLKALGESINLILNLHRALDPQRLSGSAHGRVSNLRGTRNQLVHQGFKNKSVDSPDAVYRDLLAALTPLLEEEN